MSAGLRESEFFGTTKTLRQTSAVQMPRVWLSPLTELTSQLGSDPWWREMLTGNESAGTADKLRALSLNSSRRRMSARLVNNCQRHSSSTCDPSTHLTG